MASKQHIWWWVLLTWHGAADCDGLAHCNCIFLTKFFYPILTKDSFNAYPIDPRAACVWRNTVRLINFDDKNQLIYCDFLLSVFFYCLKFQDNVTEETMIVSQVHHKHFTNKRGEILRQIGEEFGGVTISFPRFGKDSDEVNFSWNWTRSWNFFCSVCSIFNDETPSSLLDSRSMKTITCSLKCVSEKKFNLQIAQ